MSRTSSIALFFSVSALFALAPAGPAQIPTGWGVWAQFEYTGCKWGEAGGLVAFDPTTTDRWAPITNLPYALRGNGTRQTVGSNCVLIRPSDGALVVGTLHPNYSTEIHLLKLRGFAVDRANSRAFTVRTGGGWVHQLAWMHDERVAFVHSDTSHKNGGLGILDLATGKVTNVPLTGVATNPPRLFNGLALSEDGKTAYVGFWWRVGNFFGEVYKVDLATGRATGILFRQSSAQHLAVDNDGQLLVQWGDGTLTKYDVTKNSPTPTAILAKGSAPNGIEVDRLTGTYLIYDQRDPQNTGTKKYGIYRVDPAKTTNKVSAVVRNMVGCATIGVVGGLTMNHAVAKYGPASGPNPSKWNVHPGPAPRVNTTFNLRLSSPSSAAGVVGLSLRKAATPVRLGAIELVVDPGTLLAFIPTQSGRTAWALPLKIPNDPALSGFQFVAQHVQGNGAALSASRGIQIKIQ